VLVRAHGKEESHDGELSRNGSCCIAHCQGPCSAELKEHTTEEL
jgi:hypothetical protein